MNTVPFETSLKELEKIVSQLERADFPLEDQFKAFEKGVSISRQCLKELEETERKVELLVSSGDQLKTIPFEAGE